MHLKALFLFLFALPALSPLVPAYGQSAQPATGLRPFQRDGKWGYVDSTGAVRVEPRFAWAEEFHEGLAAFENEDGKHGYIDETVRVVIEPKFDNWTEFSEGLAAVSVDFKWGYIDRTGRLVIKPKYDFGWDGDRHDFSEGLVLVFYDNRCNYIDKSGKAVIKIRCNEADRFVGGLAAVHLGDNPAERRGYVNRQGRYAWGPAPFKYKSLEDIRARADKKEKEEEPLTPLTGEERALDPRRIVAGQPDFLADLTFFRSEAYSGGGGAMRLARKGKRYRMESPYWLFIGEEGKPSARVSTKTKLYDDMEPARDESADGSSPFNPRTLAEEPNVTFTTLGTVTIDGHRCLKIEAVRKGEPEKIYLYAARDLKDLIIVGQVLDPPRGFVQRLSNISLEVPDELVTIPPDYKPIEHDRWTKVETARVTYKGRQSKDFVVFRAPGGELFIRVGDAPYDWTYLVRPREETAETAFRGLLVTRDGKYVWQTKENVAFSAIGYRVRRRGPYDNPEDERAVVGPNSVKFRSNDYKKDRAMIEVRW